MATDDKIFVAVELGSTKITAIAGQKQPDGAILVLDYVQETSTSFIRKGRINNINKMAQCIHSIIKEKMEKKLNKTITRVYVGAGGMGMHSERNSVMRHLGEKTQITNEIIRSLMETNRTMPNSEREIFEVIPQDFVLGAQKTGDPVGISSESIEGHYLNIISSASVSQDIRGCFQQENIGIAGFPITVCALADAILNEAEKRSGCVLVDMGAETTTVAVFRGNLLRHLAVIPLGGASINRDLSNLQIEDDEAEELKIRLGSAYREDMEDHPAIALQDGRSINFEDFSGLVEARMEEIILNVNHQISLSGYDKSLLIGGLIITGGAAGIKDINKAFLKHTGFEKIRLVKNLRLAVRLDGRQSASFNADGTFNGAIALIDKCEHNCCGEELGTPANDLFGGNTGLSDTGNGQTATDNTAQTGGTTEVQQEEVQEQGNTTTPAKPKGESGLKKLWRRFGDFTRNIMTEEEIIDDKNKKD